MARTSDADVIEKLKSEPAMLRAVADFIATIEQRDATDQSFLAALEDAVQPPTAAHVEQLRRNAAARAQFVAEVPLLRSMDVARQTGSMARNASAQASRWKSEGRIFSVSGGGADRYPAFQFSSATGEPLPVVRELMHLFGGWNEWQIALWFFAVNAWLGDRRPLDVIEREPDAVLEAARRATESLDV